MSYSKQSENLFTFWKIMNYKLKLTGNALTVTFLSRKIVFLWANFEITKLSTGFIWSGGSKF